jgi:murein DD-endopeptidase MepM/ murein hydrolase activator NlpD
MPVPRFQPEVTTNFNNIPTFNPHEADAAAGAFQAVGNVLEETNQIATQLYKNQVVEDSTQAGTAYGNDLQNNPESLPGKQTYANQAFKQAAQQSHQEAATTYLYNLENDRVQNFSKIQQAYDALPDDQKDPNQLSAELDQWVQQTAAQQPDYIAKNWLPQASVKAVPMVQQANQDYLAYKGKQARADNIALAANLENQLLEMAAPRTSEQHQAYALGLVQLNKAWQTQGLTPNELIQKQEAFRTQLNAASHMTLFNRQDSLEKQSQYIDWFSHQKPESLGIDASKQGELANVMQAHVSDQQWLAKQSEQGLTFAQSYNLETQKNDFEHRAKSGDLTESELTNFIQKNPTMQKADGGKWAANVVGMLKEARSQQEADDSKLAMIINGHIPAAQSSEETHRLVNKAYDRAIGGVSPLTGNVRQTGAFGEQRPGHMHDGSDLAAVQGTQIVSMRSGRVISVGKKGGYGQVVEVLQDDGYTALYGHTSSQNVKKGDLVKPGQPIAGVGMTGHASGPHLHLRVTDKKGHLVNSDLYLQQLGGMSRPADLDAFAHKLIKSSGQIPDNYLKGQVIQLLHGTTQQQAEAGTRYGWLVDNHVNIKGLSEEDRGKLNAIDAALRSGKTGTQAAEWATRTTDPQYKAQLQQDSKTIKNVLTKEENKVETVFRNQQWFAPATQIPTLNGFQAALRNDWQRIFSESWVQSGGDETAARKETTRQITRIYGTSNINGKPVVMKYPPEKHHGLTGYSDDKNSEWMRKQLADGLKGQFHSTVKTENVYLVSDAITARKQPLDYQVWYKNSGGILMPLYNGKTGKIQRWMPDPNAEVNRLHAEAVARNKRETEKGKAEEADRASVPKVDASSLYGTLLGNPSTGKGR